MQKFIYFFFFKLLDEELAKSPYTRIQSSKAGCSAFQCRL